MNLIENVKESTHIVLKESNSNPSPLDAPYRAKILDQFDLQNLPEFTATIFHILTNLIFYRRGEASCEDDNDIDKSNPETVSIIRQNCTGKKHCYLFMICTTAMSSEDPPVDWL